MRTWTRPQVDKKFLENMQKLCAAGIPATAKIALAKCNGTGGPASYGAKKLFDLVAKIGWRFFDADPDQARPSEERSSPQLRLTPGACGHGGRLGHTSDPTTSPPGSL